jgi:hypothetical protein
MRCERGFRAVEADRRVQRLYSIEVTRQGAVRIVYNTILANLA